jgi:5'(3')-deoxyribonucleotidase
MKTGYNNKLTIGIDLDDTLNNLVDVWLTHYNWQFNDNLKIENIKSWEISSYVKPECGKEKLFNILKKDNWFANLGIQSNAFRVTEWLSKYYDLYIITAYFPNACIDKTKWVEKFLPHVNIENVIFCNNKTLINTDYLIDDKAETIEKFKNIGILLDKPWNKNSKHKLRICNWNDVYKYFEKRIK